MAVFISILIGIIHISTILYCGYNAYKAYKHGNILDLVLFLFFILFISDQELRKVFLFMKSEINYIELVAIGIKAHCEYWGCDYIEKLRENNSIQNFYKVFCKITNTYYVDDGKGYCDFSEGVNTYNVTFKKKKNIAVIKRCGSDWNERSEDATIDVVELIKLLVR